MKKIKIGLVGVYRGAQAVRFYHNGTRSEIAALCDLDHEKLAACAQDYNLPDSALYTDYDAFLNSDIDAVLISTPIPSHAEQVVKALEAGKHVLSEVTMSNTVEGCRAIWEAAKKAKTKYMLAENYPYYHFMREWKKYVDEGRIGRIHYAEAEYIHQIRKLLVDPKTGEAFWRTYRPPIHYCTHCLGPLLYLMGDDYIVKATASGNKNTIIEGHWPSTIDLQVALFETKQGRGIKICTSQVTPNPDPETVYYSVYGTKGFLENGHHGFNTIGQRYFENVDKETIPFNCYQDNPDAPMAIKCSHGTSDYTMAQDFLDCLEYDLTPLANEDRAMELTLPGIIAHEAAVKGGVWLDVPHFD